MSEINQVNYTEDNIKTLDWREHIRMRPGMYIGKLGDGSSQDDGIYILLKEIIDNCIDEFVMGSGKTVEINLREDEVTVRDYGRGIPLGKMIDAVSKMNTGGKYDSQAFKKSVGLNGVGTKAVNALSSYFRVQSIRDGKTRECPKDEELHVIRHTAAHILAQAVKRLYPHASFAYGPATEKGFYYDVDLGDTKLSDTDLPAIEKEMQTIIKENIKLEPFILERDAAVQLMKERNEPYKVEHISDLADDVPLSFYRQGEYVDMCVGPHLTYTKTLKAFKLTGLSGAY